MVKIIMAVDDEKHVLSSLSRLFRGKDYTFVPFHSPVAALNALMDLKPHVIISDKRMPQIEGVDFLTRASEMFHGSLRILLTGYHRKKRDVSPPVDRVITKPWHNDILKHEISRTRLLQNGLAIPLEAASSREGCNLCGQALSHWEIRFSDYSEYVCSSCHDKIMPYCDSFSESVMLNHMMGNVV